MLKPIQKTSLATSVYEQLRDLILSDKMEAGSSLPAERQLAETLGVNRSAVREALKRLEQAGLIAIHHGGNTRVLNFRRHAGPEILTALVAQTKEHTEDLRTFRQALLPQICRAAATRASAKQINRLEMLSGLANTTDKIQRRDLTAEFWNVMVDASDNIAFRLVFNSVGSIDVGERNPTSEELIDLTNAVAAGDIRGAALTAAAILK